MMWPFSRERRRAETRRAMLEGALARADEEDSRALEKLKKTVENLTAACEAPLADMAENGAGRHKKAAR